MCRKINYFDEKNIVGQLFGEVHKNRLDAVFSEFLKKVPDFTSFFLVCAELNLKKK